MGFTYNDFFLLICCLSSRAQEHTYTDDLAEVRQKIVFTKVTHAVEVRYKNFIKYKPMVIADKSPTSFFDYVKMYKRQLKRPNGYCPVDTCYYRYETKVEQAHHYIQAHCCSAIFACLNLGCYHRSNTRADLIEHMMQCDNKTDDDSDEVLA